VTFEDTFGLAAMQGELIRDEALMLHAYKDPGSGIAIGVGRNLTTQGISSAERKALNIAELQLTLGRGPGITEAQAMGLLNFDIKDRVHQLDVYIPWWRLLSPARQRVLINMAFRMGTHGMILKSPTLLAALQRAHFEEAAKAIEAADWYPKLHVRGARLAALMRQG
jgi:lysozyme